MGARQVRRLSATSGHDLEHSHSLVLVLEMGRGFLDLQECVPDTHELSGPGFDGLDLRDN
jgi:hypothetical protein